MAMLPVPLRTAASLSTTPRFDEPLARAETGDADVARRGGDRGHQCRGARIEVDAIVDVDPAMPRPINSTLPAPVLTTVSVRRMPSSKLALPSVGTGAATGLAPPAMVKSPPRVSMVVPANG